LLQQSRKSWHTGLLSLSWSKTRGNPLGAAFKLSEGVSLFPSRYLTTEPAPTLRLSAQADTVGCR
jgi:hypothetical protein